MTRVELSYQERIKHHDQTELDEELGKKWRSPNLKVCDIGKGRNMRYFSNIQPRKQVSVS